MTQGTRVAASLAVLFALAASPAAAQTTRPADDPVAELVVVWQRTRQAPAESQELLDQLRRLGELVSSLGTQQRIEAMTALMDPRSRNVVNHAALAMFGADAVPVEHVRKLLWDTGRTRKQRELLLTIYSLARDEYRGSSMSRSMRLDLLELLAERLEALKGRDVGYPEQRLLINLSKDLLSRYGDPAEVAPTDTLFESMAAYAEAAGEKDSLAASIRGWMAIRRMGDREDDTVSGALTMLGHWDPLDRWKAAGRVAVPAADDMQVLRKVWGELEDPRDEVRAAAMRTFAFSRQAGGEQANGHFLAFLLRDRSPLVQSAATDVLRARASQLGDLIDPMLDALERRRMGPKRTTYVFRVLSELVDQADAAQKARLLRASLDKLSYAPAGALAAIKALGPSAANAADAVVAYGETADRSERNYIRRHVLPVIAPDRID